MSRTADVPYLQSGSIGGLVLRNRLVRASTSETMATADGHGTQRLADFYGRLADGRIGLILSGHIFVAPEGQATPHQWGLDTDAHVRSASAVVESVHRHGGVIFAELSHAGSQSGMPDANPIAPSVVPNAMYTNSPKEMSAAEIQRCIHAFGAAAKRALAAGFDGVHIHGGNGYLISEFLSPLTNQRVDDWGGTEDNRSRFLLGICDAVREAVGPVFPVTVRIGVEDALPGGVSRAESLRRIQVLSRHGIDAVEPTFGIMSSYRDNVRRYVAVAPSQAWKNVLVQRVLKPAGEEAYYRQFARAIKKSVNLPVILVGGIRTTDTMNDVLEFGDADFVAMSRPFVREPDLARQLESGRVGNVECVSCNMCLMHDGLDPLECWRDSPWSIARHIYRYYLSRRKSG